MRTARTLLVLCVALATCLIRPAAATPYAVEVIVRTSDNFRNPADVATFVELAARNGVQAISLLVKQDEDVRIPSGRVYYRSAIAPAAAGYEHFDVLQAMIAAAHPRGIKVRAWIPQFHDQTAARRNPNWRMMSIRKGRIRPYRGSKHREYFVDPLNPEVQNYDLSIIKEIVANYAVDGVMLDWIRFDNFNMDLGTATRKRYRERHGIDPVAIDFDHPGAARDQWNEFRTDGLAAYVHEIRKTLDAKLAIGVYILPPEFVEVGQDAAKFNGATDVIAPMCYFGDWNYPIDWFWNSCLATTAQKAGAADIAPAIPSELTDEQYRQIFSHLRSDYPRIKTLAWFHHGRWTRQLLERIARLSAD